MKAAIVRETGKLTVEEIATPEPGEYQCLCKLLYGAVCAGTDTHILHHHAPFCYFIQYPAILGHESIGRIVRIGAKVRNLREGDLMTRVGAPGGDGIGSAWGGFAEFGLATDWRAMQEDGVEGWKDKTPQQILPADIDPAVGTLFITWRETLSYITRMGVGQGAKVLVIGSGGNGLAFATHARNLNASLVTQIGSGSREREGRLAGAGEYLDYRDETCWERVQSQAPEGYDFVIDALGKSTITVQGQKCLREGGTIGVYGMDECGQIRLEPGKTFRYFGCSYDEAEAHEAVLKFYRAGKLNPAIWLDRKKIFPLEKIAEALAAATGREQIKPLIRLCSAD